MFGNCTLGCSLLGDTRHVSFEELHVREYEVRNSLFQIRYAQLHQGTIVGTLVQGAWNMKEASLVPLEP